MQSKFIPWLESLSILPRAGLFAVALLSQACSSSSSNNSLVVTWTINESSDAALCTKYFGWVVVQVKDASGNHYASSNGPCSSLSASFAGIPEGSYTVTAYMFDADNNATLSTASPSAASVNSGATATDSIDFPLTVSN
jgi:hypothetical protein